MSAPTARLARLPAAEEPRELVSPEDVGALGVLFGAAFAGTVEDDGTLPANPEHDMHKALAGGFGAVVQSASLAIADDYGLRAAVITVLMDNGAPLIAFCMTAPEWQLRGYATSLISAASAALADAGHKRVFLGVHRDSPARSVYQRLGFAPAA